MTSELIAQAEARVASILACINSFQNLCVRAATMTSAEITATLAKFEAEPVEVDVYEEYLALAQQNKAEAVAHLYRLVDAVKTREAKAAAAQGEPVAYQCVEGARCVCGGDTPAVRATCPNMKPIKPDPRLAEYRALLREAVDDKYWTNIDLRERMAAALKEG